MNSISVTFQRNLKCFVCHLLPIFGIFYDQINLEQFFFEKNCLEKKCNSNSRIVSQKSFFFFFILFTTTKKNFIWKNVCPDLSCAPCTKKLYGTMTVHFIQSSLRQFWYVMVSRHEQDGGSAGAWLTLFLMATISMKKVLIFYYN